MKCPYCGGDMASGTAFIRGTLLGFFAIGLSHQHLWFRRDGDAQKEKIVHCGEPRSGHQCVRCGAVAIARFRVSPHREH